MSTLNKPSTSSFLTAVLTRAAARIILVVSTHGVAKQSYIQRVKSGSFACGNANLGEQVQWHGDNVCNPSEGGCDEDNSHCAGQQHRDEG
ncbi:hypothetical protein B0H11DRAFT_2119908 [Mycena galericulata]|nr:hypothetical protein B0H11DRAFT_2119908 [Mycena galericulata]